MACGPNFGTHAALMHQKCEHSYHVGASCRGVRRSEAGPGSPALDTGGGAGIPVASKCIVLPRLCAAAVTHSLLEVRLLGKPGQRQLVLVPEYSAMPAVASPLALLRLPTVSCRFIVACALLLAQQRAPPTFFRGVIHDLVHTFPPPDLRQTPTIAPPRPDRELKTFKD